MTTTEAGYLELPYLTYPYGSGELIDGRGLQFEALNTKQKSSGVQSLLKIVSEKNAGLSWLGNISKNETSGVQFHVFNTKQKNSGAQFRSLVDSGALSFGQEFMQAKIPSYIRGGYLEGAYLSSPYLHYENEKRPSLQFLAFNTKQRQSGVQFQGKITVEKKKGVQFLGKITQENPAGVQFKVFRIIKKGIQFRSIIYNTTQLRFLTDFASRGLNGNTWTATSTAPSTSNAFHVNNLNTDIVEQVWRSTSLVTQTLRCDTQDTSGSYVDTLAILNHNLTQGATVIFQGSNDPTFSTVGVSEVLVNNVKNTFWISPQIPLNAYRYWRFEISDPANPDGYIQIGSIVFGAASIFSSDENFTDEVNFGFKQFEDKIFTEGHTNVSNDRGQKRFIELSFDKLKADGANFKSLRRAYIEYGTLLKVLYVPIPQDPAAFSVFAKMSEVPQESHIYSGSHYVSFDIKLDESL